MTKIQKYTIETTESIVKCSSQDLDGEDAIAGEFELYLGGTKLSLQELGSAGDFKEYGANIPATLVDTLSELRFEGGAFLDIWIDDIQFSPIPVPEPSSLVLVICGAAAVALRTRSSSK